MSNFNCTDDTENIPVKANVHDIVVILAFMQRDACHDHEISKRISVPGNTLQDVRS